MELSWLSRLLWGGEGGGGGDRQLRVGSGSWCLLPAPECLRDLMTAWQGAGLCDWGLVPTQPMWRPLLPWGVQAAGMPRDPHPAALVSPCSPIGLQLWDLELRLSEGCPAHLCVLLVKASPVLTLILQTEPACCPLFSV